MEQTNTFPEHPGRRYVLAMLMKAPPSLLALLQLQSVEFVSEGQEREGKSNGSGSLDLTEYRNALRNYLKQEMLTTATRSIRDVKRRIRRLYERFPYVNSESERSALVRLLCGYQILMSGLEQSWSSAIGYLDRVIIIARQEQQYDLYAMALRDRGAQYDEKGDVKRAITDLQEAQRSIKEAQESSISIPPRLSGSIHLLLGPTKARAAQQDRDMTDALKEIDRGERYISDNYLLEESSDVDEFLVIPDKERYHLDRASIYLESSRRALRSPEKALIELDYISTSPFPRRRAQYHIRQAQAYADKKWFPTALASLQEAFLTIKGCSAGTYLTVPLLNHLTHLARVNEAIKASNYGASEEALQLELEILKMQYPFLFD